MLTGGAHWPAAASSTSAMTTLQPSAPKQDAHANPMPFAAPAVTVLQLRVPAFLGETRFEHVNSFLGETRFHSFIHSFLVRQGLDT